jgi:DDE_Tnp_1-associated
MTRTDARACRRIIPDPSRPGPPHPRRPLQASEPPHLLAYLASVPDPRATRGRRHPLVAILGLAAAAVLAGARSIAAIAEWAADAPQPVRAALGARRDVPGHFAVPAEATIRRTLSRLDVDALAVAVDAWLADRDRGPGPAGAGRRRAVAVDGKTLRGAHPPDGDGRPVHLLAAMDHTSRAVLAQHQVGGAPEEVPAFARCWPHWTSPTWWSPPTPSRPTPRPPGFLVTSKQAHYLLVVKPTSPPCWTA